MTVLERAPLAPRTTLGVGGTARFLVTVEGDDDVRTAIAFAQKQALPLRVLGAGSNVLIPDTMLDAVVVQLTLTDITITDEGETVLVHAAAGALWESVVMLCEEHALWGIENLAGIPGSVGGAAVQNIGAYGAELSSVFLYADTIDSATGTTARILHEHAALAYRSSFFKTHPALVITHVGLRLAKHALPNLSYPDLLRLHDTGAVLSTPREIAQAVRMIRANKFPANSGMGTAGSFFKNPVVDATLAAHLAELHPGLPQFPQADGRVKLPLAWILDHILGLKGYAYGSVRLFEKQPMVIVAERGATATEVDALVTMVCDRVYESIGITIEREVETFTV
ncbi:MAG: UDP-N-acetylmuramate dehydrogenase [Patescibacteria group bacterium]